MNIRNVHLKKIIFPMSFTLAGALAGYLYYYFVGCITGTCPISSNPVISTIYGSVIGLLLSFVFKKTKKET